MTSIAQLRILCLHDANSNAALLQKQLEPFGRKLYEKHGGIDLVYINSPITLAGTYHNNGDGHHHTPSLRVWWEPIEGKHQHLQNTRMNSEGEDSDTDDDIQNELRQPNPSETIEESPIEREEHPQQQQQQQQNPDAEPHTDGADEENDTFIHYRGLDASLLLLRQIWSSRPFWGILGVGQGAAMAELFTLLLLQPPSSSPGAEIIPPPAFCMFVAGQSVLPSEDDDDNNDDAADENNGNDDIAVLPCLHVQHSGDCRPGEKLLRKRFGGPVAKVLHPKSDDDDDDGEDAEYSPFNKDAWNAMGRFILQQKKRVACSDIVLLQTALYLTEQEAADQIAWEIAHNPPAPLLAVIRPQQVAGWQGTKRWQPGEEGGGAPCPSEFLLKREKRVNKNTGDGAATRMHPNQSNVENATDA